MGPWQPRNDTVGLFCYSYLMSKVITRFAPSPTGKLHIGSYRTAIFSYLYAKHEGGQFVLRIEDTDRERSKKEYEDNILESLEWLGLSHDTFVRQSENVGRHKEVLEKMIADGHAYISKEEAKDGSGVIKEIIRFKNPNIDVAFDDLIRGHVSMNTTDLGDFVLAKNINEPLFHLAVVVDDFDAGITHVIRGEDHTSNTPRQILIQRAIGAPTPLYAHLPLVLGEDKQKLSKRKGALPVTDYRDLGYLPEAILNASAMIGWNPGTPQELFTKDELVAQFDLGKVQKGGAVLGVEKLLWFNKEHMKKLSDDVFSEKAKEWFPEDLKARENFGEIFPRLISMLRDRLATFGELKTMHEDGELAYLFDAPAINPEQLCFKTQTRSDAKVNLENILVALEVVADDAFTKSTTENAITSLIGDASRGPYLHPLRYCLSGRDRSPDPFTLLSILGKGTSTARIRAAIALL